jgi:hypothetical protein
VRGNENGILRLRCSPRHLKKAMTVFVRNIDTDIKSVNFIRNISRAELVRVFSKINAWLGCLCTSTRGQFPPLCATCYNNEFTTKNKGLLVGF